MTRHLLWTAALATACGPAVASDPGRGNLGPDELYGSCAAADTCGERAGDGTCWCDDACLGYGDCCADKAPTCGGGLVLATYNAGLAHGAVPFADERVAPIVDELARSAADVLCLQEVWTDADADAIQNGLAEAFPYQFRQVTENDVSEWYACDDELVPLYNMDSCVSDACAPQGISAFECAADQCAAEWDALSDPCKLCLAANTESPTSCALWRAPMYANDGRNGVLLLSKHPLEHAAYTPFETFVVKRGVITAEVAGLQIECTHMSADLPMVPYPADAPFASWHDEHAAEVGVLAELAGDRRTVLLGDLNTGPASAGVDGELPDNFQTLIDAGFVDTWTDGAVCTYCQDNPLACSRPDGCPGGLSSRLDHVLVKNLPADVQLEFSRIGDKAITIVDGEGASHPGRLSDHYGVEAALPY